MGVGTRNTQTISRESKQMADKLLTIAIPTYNRANYLSLCLSQIKKQIVGNEEIVDILISDNCSTDNTKGVIEAFLDNGLPARVLRNNENIGSDRNFIQCFQSASGKYMLLMGDDDVLLDRGLERILNALKEDEYGVVYLRTYGFSSDFRQERPKKNPDRRVVFGEARAFIREANIMLTFISANVVNRTLVPPDFDLGRLIGSSLPQLAWNLAALFNADKNLYIDCFTVAAKSENSGGYQLCKVFGNNLAQILEDFAARGVDPAALGDIKRIVIMRYLPRFVIRMKRNRGDFAEEDPCRLLAPAFGRHASFWIILYPILKLPYVPAKIWFKICSRAIKLMRLGVA